MPKIYYLVEYLVDEHKVLPDCLLSNLFTEILDDDDYSVEQLQDIAGTDIMASGCHYVNWWFLQVGEVNSLNVEDRLDVSLWEFYFAIEKLWGVLYEIGSEVSVYDAVPSWRQEEYLRYHQIWALNKYMDVMWCDLYDW